jgi:hypothetical protein
MKLTGCEGSREKDHLHLLGLSRIPRCAACRRFEALRHAHEKRGPQLEPLPPVPPTCRYEICRPLVARSSCPIRSKD